MFDRLLGHRLGGDFLPRPGFSVKQERVTQAAKLPFSNTRKGWSHRVAGRSPPGFQAVLLSVSGDGRIRLDNLLSDALQPIGDLVFTEASRIRGSHPDGTGQATCLLESEIAPGDEEEGNEQRGNPVFCSG